MSYGLADMETKKREMDGLLEAIEAYHLPSGMILTYDDPEENIEINGKQIHILPVWKWLIE